MNIIDSFIRNILEKFDIEFLFQQVLYNKHYSPLDGESHAIGNDAIPMEMPDQVGHDNVDVVTPRFRKKRQGGS